MVVCQERSCFVYLGCLGNWQQIVECLYNEMGDKKNELVRASQIFIDLCFSFVMFML